VRKLLFMAILLYTGSVSSSNSDLSINSLTDSVDHRFYLIRRLEKTVSLITTEANLKKRLCYSKIPAGLFVNKHVKHALETMKREKNMSAFKKVWHDILAYRFIDDQTFSSDFVRLMLFICYDISSDLCKNTPTTTYHELEIKEEVSVNDIRHAFYVIQRLRKPVKHLQTKALDQLNVSDGPLSIKRHEHNAEILVGNVTFTHHRIKECINHIYTSKNSTSLLEAIQEYTLYKHTGDSVFLRELLTLTYLVYKCLLLDMFSDQPESITMHELHVLQEIRDAIHTLEIDQIIDGIDLAANKISILESVAKNRHTTFFLHIKTIAQSLLSFVWG